jgi:hypothetical protein
MERIIIEAYCFRQRNELLHELEKKITENGGWIMDHQMFSNKSISLSVVAARLKLEKIFTDLKLIELNMNPGRLESILLEQPEKDEAENIILCLSINFVNNFSSQTIRIPV